MTRVEKVLLITIIKRRLWRIPWKIFKWYLFLTGWYHFRGFFGAWERDLTFFLGLRGGEEGKKVWELI